ncbi:CHAP domain-containing protein [Streptomyces sp. NPDC089919]|uniref:CHAP domain-containing protein n=1 Tax=Streptomyces sp. NPDC089919 TaxID=3155188 RepID=UPI0034444197
MSKSVRRTARGLLATTVLACAISVNGVVPAAADAGSVASYANSQYGNDCGPYASYGACAEAWCADFARWVWAHNGAQVGGLSPAAYSFYSYGRARGTVHGVPEIGDAVVYASSASWSRGWADHVNIVVAVNGDNITTVGGNESNRVGRRTYNWRTNSNPLGAGPVRAFVGAVYNAPPTNPNPATLPSGTLVKGSGATVKVIVAGAGLPITGDDVDRDHYDLSQIVRVTDASFDALPATPPNGTIVRDQSGTNATVYLIAEGVAVPITGAEFGAYGYDQRPLMGVPTAFLQNAESRRLPDGALVKQPGDANVKVAVGGAGLSVAGGDVTPMGLDLSRTVEIPPGYYNALPTAPANGTLFKKAGDATVKVMVDGAGIALTGADVAALGYDLGATRLVPAAFFDRVGSRLPNKTLVKKPGDATVKVVVGGAGIALTGSDVTALGYDLSQTRTVAPGYFDALPTTPAVGTLMLTAGDATVWIRTAGGKHGLTGAEWAAGGYRDADIVRVPAAFLATLATT